MNDTMKAKIATLDLLLKTLVELTKIDAEPGDKAYGVSLQRNYIKHQISKIVKDITCTFSE